ncbi:hypothetical protein DRN32_03070 [Thermococci archaeon]|nr:MAG: hypothetical protein DRN32_03070 [Thermococci archaeon]
MQSSDRLVLILSLLILATAIALVMLDKLTSRQIKTSDVQKKPSELKDKADYLQPLVLVPFKVTVSAQPKDNTVKKRKPTRSIPERQQNPKPKAHQGRKDIKAVYPSEKWESPDRRPRTVYVSFDRRFSEKGRELLARGFPLILNDFSQIGLSSYVDLMLGIGGKLVAVDPDASTIIATLTRSFSPLPGNLKGKGFALDRPRDITSDVPTEVLRKLREKLKANVSICLVMPVEFESRVAGAIYRGLGEDVFSFQTLLCKTVRIDGIVWFLIHSGVRRDGDEVELDIRIPIVRI